MVNSRLATSRSSLERNILILLRLTQNVQSVPNPALNPLYVNPVGVSGLQIAPTPLPTIAPTLTQIQYVVVPTTVTFQASATMVVGASGAGPTASPSSTSRPSHHDPNSNEWELPKDFTLDDLAVQRWSWGRDDNVEVLPSLPVVSALENTGRPTMNVGNVIQVRYPEGSINPANREAPQGGMGFYASPLNISHATNVTFSYSVFFPLDFDFVKGGKLPGLYGGKTGCSGGANSDNCFSTRLMFREGGMGELYLYAPKKKQGPNVCKIPPKSYCNAEYGYSIGRGAWKFVPGSWTDVRQDIWLNTDGLPNGGFNVWVNGNLVISAHDAYYRNDDKPGPQSKPHGTLHPTIVNDPILATPTPEPFLDPASAFGIMPSVFGVLPPAPTGLFRGLILRRDDGQSIPRSAPPQIYAETVPQVQDVYNSTTYVTPLTASNDTSDSSGPTSRYLGDFPGLGYAPGYATLSSETLQQTPQSGSNYLLTSALSPTLALSSVIPTGIPQIGINQPVSSDLLTSLLNLKLRKVLNPTNTLPAKFIGIMGDTFFGGHDPSWASPKEQYTYFNSFKLVINSFETR
ncbi:family 14 polysaccharide lyase [Melampsora larici-populina 98AG31]|uniref:Family 14 polysaccharide lyase n=1 Tax=Melampsora larici-populina (strain 98AG31 / pathotype 3-4-7) TaxID=747676 RepID=F4RQ56_MELLP|nr:family 14 polysaccharide lyase [Melampsora larici-populina 98AG31]EGG05352.1 family 14 polysaccharide lyase [Melampsora larici-populina 98AG31]